MEARRILGDAGAAEEAVDRAREQADEDPTEDPEIKHVRSIPRRSPG